LCCRSSISATKATARENSPFRVGIRIASPQLTKDHRGSKKLGTGNVCDSCRETKIERVLPTLLPNSIKDGRNKGRTAVSKTATWEAQRKAAADGVFWEPGLMDGVNTFRLSEFVMTHVVGCRLVVDHNHTRMCATQ
jgi:hypothetical protein